MDLVHARLAGFLATNGGNPGWSATVGARTVSDMPAEPEQRTLLERPTGALVASLVPTAMFMAAVAIADVSGDLRSVSALGLLAAAPVYLLWVSLPSLLPISATRSLVARAGVTVIMGGVAAWAGVLVVRTDDAQAGLAVLLVPYVAVPLGLALWISRSVAERRVVGNSDLLEPAQVTHRIAALLIDIAVVAGVLLLPVTGLSDAEREVLAGVLAVGAPTLYMAGFTAWRGATLGQSALRLRVVDADSLAPIAPTRSVLRSLIVVLEVGATATVILAPLAIAEVAAVRSSGRSITDRLMGTRVVAR